MGTEVYKCPLCGATLDVNRGAEIAVCKFCRGKIVLVDDNTNEYFKLLSIANTAYDINQFEDALTNYQKILLSNPDNSTIKLKIEMCKAQSHNYIDYPLASLQDAFRVVLEKYKTMESTEQLEQVIAEMFSVVRSIHIETVSFYNKQQVTFSELSEISTKLSSCLEIFILATNYSNGITKNLQAASITLIDNIMEQKEYISGKTQSGAILLKPFILNSAKKEKLQNLRLDYEGKHGVMELIEKYKVPMRHATVQEGYENANDKLVIAIIVGIIFLFVIIRILIG